MGYVKRADLHTVFDRIRHDAISSAGCTVLLLAAVNVDALCALKILMGVLQSEFIQFKAEPVAGYDDITAISRHDHQWRSVVLIGCGAVVDVASYLRVPTRCSVYIMDGQRPWSLDNLFNNSQVFIVDDGTVEAEERVLRDAYEGSLLESEEELSDSDSDDDENVDNLARRRAKQQRKQFYEHLQQTRFGTSASRLAYELADGLNKTNNTFLWCAIVGTLSHYLLDHVSKRQWDVEVGTFRRQLARFNTATSTQPTASVRYDPEYRFTLCRHWNIHDSMFHSRYIASKLQLWRDRGWRRLTELFASMGVPLDQCKRDWFVMEKQFRDDFAVLLERYAPRFGLDEVRFASFVKDVPDIGVGVTAGDAVHALSAIIESPQATANNGGGDRFEVQRANFSVALQALDTQQLAISQHQALFKQFSAVFTHRLLRYGRFYRYAIVRGADGHLAWLQHPTALLRLALFLVDAQQATRKSHLPLLLAAHQPPSDSFLVVAVPPARDHHHDRWHFGQAYRMAAEHCRARIRHDSFDATVVEVAADDLKPFIQALQQRQKSS